MFPLQVPDTKAVGGLKNVDCSPKVKLEAVQLLALCDWVCTHHRDSAKGRGKQQPIILSVNPCLIMMSDPLKIMSCSYLTKHIKSLMQHFLGRQEGQEKLFPHTGIMSTLAWAPGTGAQPCLPPLFQARPYS